MDINNHKVSRRAVVQGGVAGAAAGMLLRGAGARQATPAGDELIPPEMATQPQGEFPLSTSGDVLRVLVANNTFVGSFEDNEFTRWYEERTGVKIEWTVLPADDAATALNVRLASGDYPDVLLSTDPSASVQQLYGTAGAFLPLNDLIDQFGTYTKWVFEQYPVARDAVTASDGNIYSLPSVNDCYHCSLSQKLWYYKPYLDELGMDVPTTTDEFEALLQAVKDTFKTANGDLVMPFSGCVGGWNGSPEDWMMESFVTQIPGGRLFIQDGKITATYTQEGWKNGLAFLGKLASEGLLDPQAFTQDYDTLVKRASANPPEVFAVPQGWFGNITNDWDFGVNWVSLAPVEGPDGFRQVPNTVNSAAYSGKFIITDQCKNPELAFRWADGLYEYETTTRSNMGVKDVDWRWAREGELGIDGQQAIWVMLNELDATQRQCWSQTGPSYRSNAWRLGQSLPESVDRARNTETVLYDATKENYEPFASDPSVWVSNLFFTDDQATLIADFGTTIDAAVSQFAAEVATGQTNVDDAWDSFQANLQAMGLQDYLAAYQAALDSKQS